MLSTVQSAVWRFVAVHDEWPAFHVLYAVSMLIAAAMFSLGTFAVLILAHALLDVCKYRSCQGMTLSQALKSTVHESLLEIALFSIALLVSVYFHSSVGFVQLSGVLRAHLSLLQFIGIVAPKYIIAGTSLKSLTKIRSYLQCVYPTVATKRWTMVDTSYTAVVLGVILLLLVAPVITQTSPTVVAYVVWHELQPFRL